MHTLHHRNSQGRIPTMQTDVPSLVGNSGGTEEDSLQFEIMKIQPKELEFKKNVEEQEGQVRQGTNDSHVSFREGAGPESEHPYIVPSSMHEYSTYTPKWQRERADSSF